MPRVFPPRWPPGAAALAAALMTCAGAAGAQDVPALDHVIVVIMENKDYGTVCAQPYTASLIAASTSFANSHAVAHPSLPNYLALWGASTMGVANDNCPADGSPFTTANLGAACDTAGRSWKAYSENLPAPGSTACSADGGLYARKHAPWTYWNNLDHTNEVPFAQLALDTAAHALPALAFVVPNNCHNTHDCDPATGDAWLQSQLPGLIDAVGANGLVILTWDEDDYAGTNHILTVFAGPRVARGLVADRPITHYTVVRTIADALGLTPFGAAASDSAVTGVWTAGEPTSVAPRADEARLEPAAPSPARGAVHALLRMPRPGLIEATILDAAGRRVRALGSAVRAGTVTLTWDGRDDSGRETGSGLYFLRVRAGGATLARRIVRLR